MNEIEETAPFFEELKKLRADRDIDLAEISTRTKINIDYLETLESGDFTFLPYVYVRLFVKAYAVEVGAETEEILQQLDHFMDRRTPVEDIPESGELHDDEHLDDDAILPPHSINNFYSSTIKVAVLVAVVFFGVWVVRQISDEQDNSAGNEPTEMIVPVEPKITDWQLNSDFIPHDEDQEWNLEPPYALTLSAETETWYELETDYSGNITSANLNPAADISFQFQENLYLRIERSTNVSVNLNGTTIALPDQDHPADIIFDGQAGWLTIRSYTPR
ncbi:MAG: hypothetical protein CMG71_07825 [Candidatus Marinimicrobia bacterium]|nr:hypothetical protein [Candidatus Neomarinimicrobiota bacterium]|tara:strand:- start:1991 stop:2818 length:828 start_codon:yes stop_codon:yes gene_type:complete